MRTQLTALSLSALMMMSAAESMAAPITIDFDGIAPVSTFTAGVEDGFIITATGPVAVNNAYLAPASGPNSLHHQNAGSASFFLSRTNAGDFKFTSFMAGSAFGGANPLSLQGFLNGVLVGTDLYSAIPNGSFTTLAPINLSGKLLDSLVFNLGPATAGPTHIDNVRLDTVDVVEPASMALLAVGLLAAGVTRRRKS